MLPFKPQNVSNCSCKRIKITNNKQLQVLHQYNIKIFPKALAYLDRYSNLLHLIYNKLLSNSLDDFAQIFVQTLINNLLINAIVFTTKQSLCMQLRHMRNIGKQSYKIQLLYLYTVIVYFYLFVFVFSNSYDILLTLQFELFPPLTSKHYIYGKLSIKLQDSWNIFISLTHCLHYVGLRHK